jgi:hypothetical protein
MVWQADLTPEERYRAESIYKMHTAVHCIGDYATRLFHWRNAIKQRLPSATILSCPTLNNRLKLQDRRRPKPRDGPTASHPIAAKPNGLHCITSA